MTVRAGLCSSPAGHLALASRLRRPGREWRRIAKGTNHGTFAEPGWLGYILRVARRTMTTPSIRARN